MNPAGGLGPPKLFPPGRFTSLDSDPGPFSPNFGRNPTPFDARWAGGRARRGVPSARLGRLFRLMILFGRPAPSFAGGCTKPGPLIFRDRNATGERGVCEDGFDGRLIAPRAEAAVTERSRRFGGGRRFASSSAHKREPVEKRRSLEVSLASALRPTTRRVAWRGISSSLLWGLVDDGPCETGRMLFSLEN